VTTDDEYLKLASLSYGKASIQLYTCLKCGTVVTDAARKLHSAWHKREETEGSD
jgi:hypothetical protein